MKYRPRRGTEEAKESFRAINLKLDPDLSARCEAYHASLRNSGICGSKQDTVRELINIALTSEPEKIIPLCDRERAWSFAVRSFLSQVKQFCLEKHIEIGESRARP